MNIEEYVNKIKILEDENMQLKNKLKTYTAPTRNTKIHAPESIAHQSNLRVIEPLQDKWMSCTNLSSCARRDLQ